MATITAKVTSIEQVVGGLAARVAALEAGAVSASSVSGSPSASWPLPGQIDGSTATVSRDPDSSEEGRNIRRRLNEDTSPEDENSRSAVLLRFPCEPCLPGMHAWFERHSLQLLSRKESPAEEEPNQLESYFLQDQNVKVLWQDSRMAAYRIQSTALFCIVKSRILVRQSRS